MSDQQQPIDLRLSTTEQSRDVLLSPTQKELSIHATPSPVRASLNWIQTGLAGDVQGAGGLLGHLWRLIGRLLHTRLVKTYYWAVIPLIVIGAVQVNAHIYYNIFWGYDMPLHFDNTYAILTTGNMPAPPDHPTAVYPYQPHGEAFQPELFYMLSAWAIELGKLVIADPVAGFIPVFLLLIGMIWYWIICVLVQRFLKRTHPLLRALTVCVIMLPTGVIMATAMFNNDLPVQVMSTLALLQLWLMVRSGRTADRRLWLRVAALIGIGISFKTTGVVLAGILFAFGGLLMAGNLYRRHYRTARHLLTNMLISLPLIALPYFADLLHVSQYSTAVSISGIGGYTSNDGGYGLSFVKFMTSFDSTALTNPVGDPGSGRGSAWSRLYATYFGDIYSFWFANPAKRYDRSPEALEAAHQSLIWAMPVAILIALGYLSALYRIIRHSRRAMRDGSTLIVVAATLALAALLYQLISVQSLGFFLSRYILYIYPFLIVTGIFTVWQLARNRRSLVIPLAKLGVWATLVVFCIAEISFVWLTPG